MPVVELQSKEHRNLLDIVDKLRSQGLGKYVDLPEIIVCGDQSAGKSSVLEAISGMSFPTKDNLCTRFPTELILRHASESSVKITITPGPDRSLEEREKLLEFKPTVVCDEYGLMDSDALGSVIESAKEVMGLSDTKVFSTDALRVDLSGPDQPHLTMVDLPGLFRAGNKEQSVNDATTVRNMVRSYMERPRSIILAVVSAKSDSALQDVTEFARELDPDGVRTLGLITKPDTLDAGSDSEQSYVRLAQNKDVVFKLGWHILKNRDYKHRNATTAQRDAAERAFFAKGVWSTIDPTLLGVDYLKPRLSNVLKDQILRQLPSLVEDVESGLADCERRLQVLGDARTTLEDQRQYLLRVSQQFSTFMTAAVDGTYTEDFFGSSTTRQGIQKRLRAIVQNSLIAYMEDMEKRGHSRTIIEGPVDPDQIEENDTPPKKISRADYLVEIKSIMGSNRGRELPGTFNPLIIAELFAEQARPWQSITYDIRDNILDAVSDTIKAIVSYVAVKETVRGLLKVLISGLVDLTTQLQNKLNELLNPHNHGHPITYNHYFTETIQKIQASRKKKAIEKALQSHLNVQGCGPGVTKLTEYKGSSTALSVDLSKLVDTLMGTSEADMEQYACSTAADFTQAYYKVALKRFVDDVAVLGIEECLMKKLPSLFSQEMVLDMDDEEVTQLAGESPGTVSERLRCKEKRDVLVKGLAELKLLGTHGAVNHRKRAYSSTTE